MRTKQTLDEKKEKLLYGCLFGFILFASSAIYISTVSYTHLDVYKRQTI